MQVPGWLNQDLSSINCSTPVRDRPDSCELTTLVQSTFGHHGWWMQPTSKLEYESRLAKLAEPIASYATSRGQHKAAAATDYGANSFHSKMRQQQNTTETQHFFRDATAAKAIVSKGGVGRYGITIEHPTMQHEISPRWPQWRRYWLGKPGRAERQTKKYIK